ncbi:MAG: PIN domain-containing protein [Anaerolineae bacterium]
MSAPIFVDTGYILALVNTSDQYHPRARATAAALHPPFVTTEAVLVEIGNALSKLRWRHLGIDTLRDLRTDPDIEVMPVDAELFDRAVALYSSRPDKEWGLTDCISFVVMQERNLTHALTTDRDFEQAGFQNALLDI